MNTEIHIYSCPSLLRPQKIFNILSYNRKCHNNKKRFIKKILNEKVKIMILMLLVLNKEIINFCLLQIF
jgi:hypothetical protein